MRITFVHGCQIVILTIVCGPFPIGAIPASLPSAFAENASQQASTAQTQDPSHIIGPQVDPRLAPTNEGQASALSNLKVAGSTLLDDVLYLATSPSRMDLESGLITAGVVGVVGGVMVFDSNIQKWVQRNQSQSGNDFFNRVQTVGDAALPLNAGLAAAGYFFRGSEEGNKLFQTSLVSIEAQMLAGGLTQMAKFAIGRDRPNQDPQGNSYDPFQKFGQSFPSGHATQMFALAAVFSEQYSLPVQVLVYSLAIAVSAERVYDNQHFTSDVLAGAAIGYVVGKTLAFRHTYGDRGLSFMPLAVPGGGGVTLQYRF